MFSKLIPSAKTIIRKSVHTLFVKHILATNIISSGILMGLGDIIQQQIEYHYKLKTERVDFARLGRMFTVGLIEGPFHHVYYVNLDRILPGMDLTTVFKKILLDQTVASPLFIAIFFYGMGIMEGKSLYGCTIEIKENIWTVYLADWCVWPPTQFINFYWVPGPYRIVYINAVTMLYNVFLSYVKHRDSVGVKTEKSKEKSKMIFD